jgi:CxxC motif-containing protein (DUF1111 family)
MKAKSVLSMVLTLGFAGTSLLLVEQASSQTVSSAIARDPGVRAGVAAGKPFPTLTPGQLEYFKAGRADFAEAEEVADGLGPTFNLDSCGGCHSQPALGGTSPSINPQVSLARKYGNVKPPFLSETGPVREARFVRNPDGTPDGGVHSLFTVCGSMQQPDFKTALANGNVIFRIPTPLFGAGLIEQIPDTSIVANRGANASQKRALGIVGRPNIVVPGNTISGQPNANGNDGTFARFGWKAQNKSLLLFAGEAYNVEMGISNELFQTERNESTCKSMQPAATPNDVSDFDAKAAVDKFSGIEKFTFFMRFLAPPTPSTDTPGGAASIGRGKALFVSTGCALCHTPTLTTGNAKVAALSGRAVNLYSDLLVHDMGPGLADGVTQGQAGPREFRTVSSSCMTGAPPTCWSRSVPIKVAAAAGTPRKRMQ